MENDFYYTFLHTVRTFSINSIVFITKNVFIKRQHANQTEVPLSYH